MILLVSPAGPGTTLGNGVTAQRWTTMLRQMGHEVVTVTQYVPGEYSALIALHARKSSDAIRTFRARHPKAPVVIALTGTDLYPDLVSAGVDPEILEMADRLVVLQTNGLVQLGPDLWERTRTIVQSVPDIPPRPRRTDAFTVVLLAHLRPVKDPMRAAMATRLLPDASRIRVIHAGKALDPALATKARNETVDNPRYEWLGGLARNQALTLLSSSHLLVSTSLHEGGANVISEALAAGVPVVCSDIPGATGLLGEDYPGYFPPRDTESLASLLHALERNEGGRYRELRQHCGRLRTLVEPSKERQSWSNLLSELGIAVSI